MSTYVNNSLLVNNVLEKPLFTNIPKKDIQEFNSKYGFGHEYYLDVYIMFRNFTHCVSLIEDIDNEKSLNSIKDGLNFLSKPFKFHFECNEIINTSNKLFEDHRMLFISDIEEILFYAIDDKDKVRFISDKMDRCKTWNDLVLYISSMGIFSLYNIVDSLKFRIFKDYKFENESMYSREIEAGLIITILSIFDIVDFFSFKNQTI